MAPDVGERPELRSGHSGAALHALIMPAYRLKQDAELRQHGQHLAVPSAVFGGGRSGGLGALLRHGSVLGPAPAAPTFVTVSRWGRAICLHKSIVSGYDFLGISLTKRAPGPVSAGPPKDRRRP